jgi:hypothetical protein
MFTALPDDPTLAATALALQEDGFSVEVVDDLEAARVAVLARIPEGASVLAHPSTTLQETGIAQTVEDRGRLDPAQSEAEYVLGSVQAITCDGTLVIASGSGRELASYAWGAANVIFVVGAQKLVPDPASARIRIFEHSIPPEKARADAADGQRSRVGKILEIHQEDPGRIHVVLIRQVVGGPR